MEQKVTFWQKCRSGKGGFPEILSKNSQFLDKKHQTKKKCVPAGKNDIGYGVFS